MKKVAIYMYNTSPVFEVAIATYILHTKYDVCVISDEKNNLNTPEGLSLTPNYSLKDIDIKDFDALVICGGEFGKIGNKKLIINTIEKAKNNNKFIAAICSGRELVNMALKKNYKITDSINYVEKGILFSPAKEYAMFGIIIGKHLEIYKDYDDYYETIDFFYGKK